MFVKHIPPFILLLFLLLNFPPLISPDVLELFATTAAFFASEISLEILTTSRVLSFNSRSALVITSFALVIACLFSILSSSSPRVLAASFWFLFASSNSFWALSNSSVAPCNFVKSKVIDESGINVPLIVFIAPGAVASANTEPVAGFTVITEPIAGVDVISGVITVPLTIESWLGRGSTSMHTGWGDDETGVASTGAEETPESTGISSVPASSIFNILLYIN